MCSLLIRYDIIDIFLCVIMGFIIDLIMSTLKLIHKKRMHIYKDM